QGLQRYQLTPAISVPPLVTQIGDGENGGVMMNEFPGGYRQAAYRAGTEGVVLVNVTEYLEMLEQAGVRDAMFPGCRPIHQSQVLARISKWQPGATDQAIAEIKREQPQFTMDGGSWTNNISWVAGYENVLTPMNQLSARFHQVLDQRTLDKNARP